MSETTPPGPPAQDFIRYDLLTQAALRGVVRDVLSRVSREGVPGEHHFYISFRTTDPAVRLSQRLKERYPGEMTIVLQHQFWDLDVDENGFDVGLSFGNVPEKLHVPFASVTGFFDPSVQFGLKFDNPDAPEEPAEDVPPGVEAETPDPAPVAEEETSETPPGGGAQVVSLDKFRKK
ncbi:hypothetical protein IHQ68_02880 [Chelatococcus sambhunathii]|uniref:Stringent starvation protein B n=1 Tax=Chelatococcus sambhunathii TaxID=363953 RepID=A0ABU1DBW0_9HYPH|nr:SspB family protein [Chelatococcus sambhunathii]MDR4305567.1 hypothetical protein [Chelatococcus sambhunathii]